MLFRSPDIDYRVNTSLARCKITGDVGDEVQRVHLAMNGNLHAVASIPMAGQMAVITGSASTGPTALMVSRIPYGNLGSAL